MTIPFSTASSLHDTKLYFPVFTYAPGNQSAGIAYKGNYRTFVLGFPFESILSEADRAIVMAGILGFFTQK